MKILITATYFYPYSSGLSVYALRVARGLVGLGHEVCVLTSQYDKNLPGEENLDGVKIVRLNVGMKLSKGVMMPGLKTQAKKWIAWADVVNVHMPQFESFVYARLTKQMQKPLVVTYHCDLVMSGGWFNRLAGWGTNLLGKQTLKQAGVIVQNTFDYARHSKVLKAYLDKVVEVPTPVVFFGSSPDEKIDFRKKFGLAESDKVLGLAGRVASEKGYEYLAQALPLVWEKYPTARVVHAGSWKGVIGEEAYLAKMEGLIRPFGEKWKSLGFLTDEDFMRFFAACDLLVFSSLNATESFGIVKIEAMSQGTPVVASDLAGVRQPVLQTKMGRIVLVRDISALAEGIISVLDESSEARIIPESYLKQFEQEKVAERYQEIFASLV
jgi:glycosyltransferase involved in cell wall biosynthesis